VQLRSLDIPSLLALPPGCTFHPRCPLYREGLCDATRPALEIFTDSHAAACYLAGQRAT
jgi:peptide/nickel transport system ATP-binding protein